MARTVDRGLRRVPAGARAALERPRPSRALIEALRHRYPSPVPKPLEDCTIWNDDYADAMRDVYGEFADDLDIATLFAEALMNRTPWQLWDLRTGEAADGANTVEAIEVLERALGDMEAAGDGLHPGVLHMYIHLMEMSPHPERALRAGDRLRDLVPDAGHLRHMPTHIDVLCGTTATSSRRTSGDRGRPEVPRARGADQLLLPLPLPQLPLQALRRDVPGPARPALEAADEMVATIPEELLRVEVPPMADWLESFVPMKMHVLDPLRQVAGDPRRAAAGRQDAVLRHDRDEALREGGGLRAPATSTVAEGAARALRGGGRTASRPSRYLFNNSCHDILAIAAEMLAGELEYRKGNHDVAFAHLRRSVELDDGLPYDEPWGWMQPTRHAYGALLLEQGQVEEAEAVYRADLGLDDTLARACQHPDNVWSLHGYHECLTRLGRTTEARSKQRLDLALARADVPIRASCYCRLERAAA